MSLIGAVMQGAPDVLIGGLPAARVSDIAAHGGAIVAGCPTVRITSLPAARMADPHVCPMFEPPAMTPHVGGIITGPCLPSVRIGGKPAARITDMTICTGPGKGALGGGSHFVPGKDGTCRGKPLYAQQAPMSCALAAARMMGDGSKSEQDLVDEFGKPALYKDGVQTQDAGPYTPESGTDGDYLPAVVKYAGGGDSTMYDPEGNNLAEQQKDGINHLQNCGGPCIVGVDNGDGSTGGAPRSPPSGNHAVVVDGIVNGQVLIRDPYKGAPAGCQSMSIAQFNKKFDPNKGIVCK